MGSHYFDGEEALHSVSTVTERTIAGPSICDRESQATEKGGIRQNFFNFSTWSERSDCKDQRPTRLQAGRRAAWLRVR